MLQVAIADSQALPSAGIRYLLEDSGYFTVTNPINHQKQLFIALEKQKIDILILDHQTIEGFEIKDLSKIKEKYPSLYIFIISEEEDKDIILRTIELEISGFLEKKCSQEEMTLAIRSIRKQEKFFSNKIAQLALENQLKKEGSDSTLTQRETEILKLIVEGNSTLKIADQLNLSYHTINTHRKSIIRKLKIKSPIELVIYAMDTGLIKPKI